MTRKYIFINTPSLKIELAQRELENDSWNNERRKRNVTLTWNPPWLAMFEGTKNPSPSVNRAWTPLCHPLPLPCSTLWPPVPSKLRIHAVSRGITPPIVYVKGWPSCRKRREGREGRLASGNNVRVNVLLDLAPFRSSLSNYTFLSFAVYVCQRYCALRTSAVRLLSMKRWRWRVGNCGSAIQG